MKLDLLTNATGVDDAIRFISSNQSKEKIILASTSNNKDITKNQKNLTIKKIKTNQKKNKKRKLEK
jgi:hypothetical protein